MAPKVGRDNISVWGVGEELDGKEAFWGGLDLVFTEQSAFSQERGV